MNGRFDSVDETDVQECDALRQSELVSRMTQRTIGALGEQLLPTPTALALARLYLERSIMSWLLDNNLVIKRDMR